MLGGKKRKVVITLSGERESRCYFRISPSLREDCAALFRFARAGESTTGVMQKYFVPYFLRMVALSSIFDGIENACLVEEPRFRRRTRSENVQTPLPYNALLRGLQLRTPVIFRSFC